MVEALRERAAAVRAAELVSPEASSAVRAEWSLREVLVAACPFCPGRPIEIESRPKAKW